eukprot:TRINITY_DN16282_c0_g1_i1.p1 TRINITY_DN16282_c0_g1~~TRINITY_DN16282_c0_g1_i1.p1  ORF type:complete len:295 (-),score=81.32 TRINITY_DN16282_c0_g1_i1:62-946(-)
MGETQSRCDGDPKKASAVGRSSGCIAAPLSLTIDPQRESLCKYVGGEKATCCREEFEEDGYFAEWSVDHQLLAAARRGDLAAISKALDRGANLEARRPLVLGGAAPMRSRPRPVLSLGLQLRADAGAEACGEFQDVFVLEADKIFKRRPTTQIAQHLPVLDVRLGGGDLPDSAVPSEEAGDDDSPGVLEATSQGFTPLMLAAKSCQLAAVDFLLQRRASVEARDEQGRTALHLAAGAGSKKVCEVLVERGVDAKCRDALDRDAFDHVPGVYLGNTRERAAWLSLLRRPSVPDSG